VRFTTQYPGARKLAAGGIDALTGRPRERGLHQGPQDFVILPGQPWLDGFCVAPGVVR